MAEAIRDAAKDTGGHHTAAHIAWQHRKVWAITRRDGLQVSPSMIMPALRDENLLQAADFLHQLRQLTAAGKAALLVPPTGPKHDWQMDYL